jgi:antitoxin component YwqK of YwqJK toxin-antitoxin module
MLLKTNFYFLILFVLLAADASAQFASVDTTSDHYQAFYYESGQLSSHGNLINGKPDGYWVTYHENGTLKSVGNRVDFKLDSTWFFYSEHGNLIKSINYKDDLKNGLSVTYDSIFKIRADYYVDDIRNGLSTSYYVDSSNSIKSTVNYFQGKEDGKAFYFAKDGRVIGITEFNKGFIVSKEEINRLNKQEQPQGIWKDFYPNWRVKSERTYRNGLLNGYYKYYTPEGQLTKAELYVDGVLQKADENDINFQIIPVYNSDGTMIQEVTYNSIGQKDGIEKYYNDSGEVTRSNIYKNDVLLAEGGFIDEKGRKQELWKEYYPNRSLKSKGVYLDNKKYEKWEYFYENGNTEQVGKYNKNGKPIGTWVWYYENGDTLRYEQYRRGYEDGQLIEKTDSGITIRKGEYIDGFKEGEWIYELNDHIEKGSYVYGTKNGEWFHYHSNGELIFRGAFIEDRPEGKHKWWYPNGKIKKEGSFAYGEKNGTWKKYDENGVLLISIDYKDGKEYKIDGKKFKIEKRKHK